MSSGNLYFLPRGVLALAGIIAVSHDFHCSIGSICVTLAAAVNMIISAIPTGIKSFVYSAKSAGSGECSWKCIRRHVHPGRGSLDFLSWWWQGQGDVINGFSWSSTRVQRGSSRASSEIIFCAALKLRFPFAFDVLPLISVSRGSI